MSKEKLKELDMLWIEKENIDQPDYTNLIIIFSLKLYVELYFSDNLDMFDVIILL